MEIWVGIMQATESALRAQHEQEASIVTEMTGYRRALKEVQAHNEQVQSTPAQVYEVGACSTRRTMYSEVRLPAQKSQCAHCWPNVLHRTTPPPPRYSAPPHVTTCLLNALSTQTLSRQTMHANAYTRRTYTAHVAIRVLMRATPLPHSTHYTTCTVFPG